MTLIFQSLLVVDEVGCLPISRTEAMPFLQLMSQRCETTATILNSNKRSDEWGAVYSDEALMGTFIDRLLHHCHIVYVQGSNYRIRQHTELYAVLQPRSEADTPSPGKRSDRGGRDSLRRIPHRLCNFSR